MTQQLQALRGFVRRRLTAAVDEIFGQLERTIGECEAELQRRSALLQAADGRAEIHLVRTDVNQPMEEEEQQVHKTRTSSVDQEEPRKQVQEEPRMTCARPEPQEALMSDFPSVQARSEVEEAQGGRQAAGGGGSSLDYVVSDADGSQESELESVSDPDVNLQPHSAEEIQELLKVERGARHGWKKTRDPQLSFVSLNNSIFFKLVITREEEPRAKMEIKCPMCPKTLSSSRSLKAHMRCHTGEEPYSCSFCGKRFKWNADCASHMRVHTGERPYVCDICGKGYMKSGHLRQHVRGHATQKPFHCQDCGRRFANNHRYSQHKCTAGAPAAQCEVKVEFSD